MKIFVSYIRVTMLSNLRALDHIDISHNIVSLHGKTRIPSLFIVSSSTSNVYTIYLLGISKYSRSSRSPNDQLTRTLKTWIVDDSRLKEE